MKCPYCNQDNTRVVDSRPVDDNTAIRRRRMCDECGKRFTTYEKVETIPLIVIKKIRTENSMTARRLKREFCAPATSGQFPQNRFMHWWIR